LKAYGLGKLNSIKGFKQLTKFLELDVTECFDSEELPGVENFRSLEKLKSIQGLENLTELLGVAYKASRTRYQILEGMSSMEGC
jgi:hypothetical protein